MKRYRIEYIGEGGSVVASRDAISFESESQLIASIGKQMQTWQETAIGKLKTVHRARYGPWVPDGEVNRPWTYLEATERGAVAFTPRGTKYEAPFPGAEPSSGPLKPEPGAVDADLQLDADRIIESLSYLLGSAVREILGGDLDKAQWYLKREIARRQ